MYFSQLLNFPILYFFIPSPFIICAIFYYLNAGFFHTIRVSNSLDLEQARHFVGPDLGPKLFAKVSADNKKKDKYKTTCCYYFLAKTLAKVNLI